VKRAARARLRQLARTAPTPAHLREIATLALTEADRTQRIFETVFGGWHTLPLLLTDDRIPEERRVSALRAVATRIARRWKLYPDNRELRDAIRERARAGGTTTAAVKSVAVATGLHEALKTTPVPPGPTAFYAAQVVTAAIRYAKSDLLSDTVTTAQSNQAQVDAVLNGAAAVDAFRAAEAAADATVALAAVLERLTPRQSEYLEYKAAGLTNRQICETMGLTEGAGSRLWDRIQARAAGM
jgi:DNA-directed RNA polymerase specialized sigma24 family protein